MLDKLHYEPNLLLSVQLLVRLHRLIAADEGDGDEADEVRDKMESPWYRMSDYERRLIDILATDLYRFDEEPAPSDIAPARVLVDLQLLSAAGIEDGREADAGRNAFDNACSRVGEAERARLGGLTQDLRSLCSQRSASPVMSHAVERAFQQPIDAHDWDAALSSLRENESAVPAAELATLRGICWANLDYHEVASWFFGDALRRMPDNIILQSLYLRSLVRAGDLTEAKSQAAFLARTSADPYRLLMAANVLLQCIVDVSEGQPPIEDLEQVVKLVERAPVNSLSTPPDPSQWSIASAGYLSAAWAYHLLGDRERAEETQRGAQLLRGRGEQASVAPTQHFAPGFAAAVRQQREVIDLNLMATVPAFVLH